jgi:hypothetical protein
MTVVVISNDGTSTAPRDTYCRDVVIAFHRLVYRMLCMGSGQQAVEDGPRILITHLYLEVSGRSSDNKLYASGLFRWLSK